MDPVSHGLASFALTRAVFPRVSRLTLIGAVVAGTIADIDGLSARFGPAAYLAWHRAILHSVVAAVGFALIISIAVVSITRGRPTKNSSRNIFLATLCAAILHLAMDICQSDGVQLLWPVRRQRYATDWLAWVDLWIFGVLLLGVLLPKLFGLVTEEIGAKTKGPRGRWGAAIALGVVVLYVGTRGVLHGNAIAMLESRMYRGESPRRVAAFAESDSPLHWHGVVETERALHDLELELGSGASLNPDAAQVSYKPEPSPALEAARNTDAAKEFLKIARFPKASVEKTITGFRVEIRAFPYLRDARSGWGVLALIETDSSAKVMREEIVWDPASREVWWSYAGGGGGSFGLKSTREAAKLNTKSTATIIETCSQCSCKYGHAACP
jgi:inner membrane protein